jgi:flagellar FliL protein
MSKAAAADAGAAPKKLFSAKLLMLLAVVLLLLAVVGGGALLLLKQKAAAAAAEEGDDDETTELAEPRKSTPKRDPGDVPTFLPLDPFTVNLADKDQERYAQVSITLEVDDAKFAEQMKTYMPAIRNGVLMILAHKSSAELLERAGKERLAMEIQREAVRPLGIEIEDDEDEASAGKASNSADDEEKPRKKKRKRKPEVHNPVQHVHFSNFIIQ